MPAPGFQISPALVQRLPVSFASYCLDQMKEWDLLFPAERSYYERLFGLLERSAPAEVERLFAPTREIERKMGINDKTFPRGQFPLEQVDFLNRNPHYPEWRAAVAQVFAHIDPLLDNETARSGHARLVVVIAPAQLPAGPDRMWSRVAGRGKRIAIEVPERPEEFLPLFLTGQERGGGGANIAYLFAATGKGGPYSSWIVEAGSAISQLGTAHGSVTKYSYEALDTYRRRLMREVRQVVDSKEIPGPRQLSARLKQMKILASEAGVADDPILAEFARAILLSGNGTLPINNTFVEWATVQAVRRG